MCLLVVLHQIEPDAPLVVAANRDERLERPTTTMAVLSSGPSRIIGGRDEQAGGTWLAVNEHGVVAGLTNRPAVGGRDPAKRSRGELPLWLAGHRHAAAAAEGFFTEFDPGDFNPCWLLVGDRDALFSLDMTGEDGPHLVELPPGAYVLENSALGEPTPKRVHVRRQLAEIVERRGLDVVDGLAELLRDHRIPDGVPIPDPAAPAGSGEPSPPVVSEPAASEPGDQDGTAPDGTAPAVRAPELSASCVHIEGYGTRSSLICRVPSRGDLPPQVLVADGPPCVTPMLDVTHLWAR